MARLRLRLILAILLSAAVLAGAIGVGSIRTPTGRIAGSVVSGSPAPLPAVFRVATMNIHGGIGPSDREDLRLTAGTLDGIDIAGLNEVSGAMVGPGQVEKLSKLTGMMGQYFPTERQYWHDAFGNALLTRLPFTGWERMPLPSGPEGSRRNVSVIRFGNEQLTVIVTHTARHADQSAQLQYVSKLFLSNKPPVILIGDMNATSEHPLIVQLLAVPDVRNPVDEKRPEMRGKHIDWIFVRGLDVRDAGVRDLGASDHPMVWAELALKTLPEGK